MSTSVSAFETITRFAELSARLNEGFADRTRVLETAGLDESSWERFESQCATALAEDMDNVLALRFSDVYAAERGLLSLSRSSTVLPACDPRFLNNDAQSWREEAAAVPLDASHVAPPPLFFGDEDTEDPAWPSPQLLAVAADMDQTAEFAARHPGPVLPFVGARGIEESGVRSVPVARCAAPPSRIALAAPDTTAELATNAARVPALPFADPGPPGRRLHSFDSQTGQPLATPYWVGDAADPTKSA